MLGSPVHIYILLRVIEASAFIIIFSRDSIFLMILLMVGGIIKIFELLIPSRE
jgi:hypothetical protein